VPKKQSTSAQRAREAARQGAKYTQALRSDAGTAASVREDDGFGGHEFEYEQATDLFRCTECRVYEVTARDTDRPIRPCAGLAGIGRGPTRVGDEVPHGRRSARLCGAANP
jgi:hypothetical protein